MRFLPIGAPPSAVCALGVLTLVGATSILTFSDSSCRMYSASITAKDSTGSGECRKLTSGFTSFMIGSLGDGCTVTIYGNDPKDPICSATNNTLAETTVCYNSTWSYFSVDFCASLDTTRLSSTSIPTLATSTTTTSTSISISIPASSTSTDTPTAIAEPASGGVNVGAIVGGTVSGIFVGALLAGAAFYFFWFRPKQQIKLAELSTMQDTSTTRINGSYVEDDTYTKPDSYAKSDARTRTGSYAVLPEGSEVYELSPQYIAEVHEQTHVRHELPP